MPMLITTLNSTYRFTPYEERDPEDGAAILHGTFECVAGRYKGVSVEHATIYNPMTDCPVEVWQDDRDGIIVKTTAVQSVQHVFDLPALVSLGEN